MNMVKKTEYEKIKPYTTKDGSLIRELMNPDIHGHVKQSLAEAIVPVNGMTHLHRHGKSEELYHITQGHGVLFLGEEHICVTAGYTVYIPPHMPHQIKNEGEVPLKILCCSYPAYSHDDTELLS
jgi:mannose-6-phosphate isomerase-like protein (cupin superfamily)